MSPLNRSKMYRAVDSFRAVGETPIAHSLGKSVADLGDSGRRMLVLISDGEESCAGDPCPAARRLAKNGGEDPRSAPPVAAGQQYRDRYVADGTPRYYRIPRTPGHAVTASITSLVPPTRGQNLET